MKKAFENGSLEIVPALALEIGLNESIVLQQLFIHVQKGSTILDGKQWLQKTYEEWQNIFPFWSISTIKRIFSSLQKKGMVLIEQHGKHQYNRTNWYAISEDALQIILLDEDVSEIEKAPTEEENHSDNQITDAIHQKYISVKKRLKELRFFPLKKQHCEELMKVCQSYSVEQIVTALEQTASKCIYAWKYAYKVLMTSVKNQTQSPVKQWKPRKVIRTEIVPDWFQSNQNETMELPETDEDFLAKRRRLEAIQLKYKQKAMATSMSST